KGSIADDGLPAGSVVTSVWTVVSGPGQVNLQEPAAASTTATFGAPGTYVLRLVATDGEFGASDDVVVRVLIAVPSVVGLAPAAGQGVIVSAGLARGTVTDIDNPITLAFGPLPSQQGFQFNANGTSEGQVFS